MSGTPTRLRVAKRNGASIRLVIASTELGQQRTKANGLRTRAVRLALLFPIRQIFPRPILFPATESHAMAESDNTPAPVPAWAPAPTPHSKHAWLRAAIIGILGLGGGAAAGMVGAEDLAEEHPRGDERGEDPVQLLADGGQRVGNDPVGERQIPSWRNCRRRTRAGHRNDPG